MSLDPSKFCPLDGFCAVTNEYTGVGAVSLCLPVDVNRALYTALSEKGEGAYTRLVVWQNGLDPQHLIVTLSQGRVMLDKRLRRGVPACSSVEFRMTADAVKDIYQACQAEATEAAESETPVAKIPGYEFTGFDDDGNPCYESTVDCEWKSGTHRIKSAGGIITECEPLTASEIIEDGTYTSIDEVTVKDGCVVNIKGRKGGDTTTDCNTCDPCTAGVAR